MTESSSTSQTRSVDRALDLLTIVCESGGVSLSECARGAGLPLSSTQRLLQSLVSGQFITRDREGLFRPGFLMMKLGAASLSQDNLIWVASRHMRELVRRTGESVYLAVEGTAQYGLYIHVIEGTHSIRHANWVGRTVPLAGSAVGHALLGKVPPGDFTSIDAVVEPDVTAIAAGIYRGEHVWAALNLLVPSYRMNPEKVTKFGSALAEAAQAISANFSGATTTPHGPDAVSTDSEEL